jgi:hypothetical protein
MASAPSIFYVNRDNYLAALDASRRAGGQFSPPLRGRGKCVVCNARAGLVLHHLVSTSLAWRGLPGCPFGGSRGFLKTPRVAGRVPTKM